MAKVQYGSFVVNLTGSVGGTTFQRNRSGDIARNRGGTRRRQTTRQSTTSAEFTKFLTAWAFIGLANQTVWNDFAALNPFEDRYGTTKTLTGMNYFMSVNRSRDLVGLGLILFAPTNELPVPFDLDIYTVDSALLQIQQTAGTGAIPDGLLVYCTGPVSRSTTSFRREMKLIHTQLGWDDSAINLNAAFQNTFGYPWSPTGDNDDYKVGIMLVSVDFDSGLTGVGVLALGSFVNTP